MSQTRTIRWVLYHEPIELFLRTAEAFAEEVGRLTNDTIKVEIYTLEQFAKTFGKDSEMEPVVWMQNGDCEMTQAHVAHIAVWHAPDFWALEMPFLFDSHEHATRVLEGTIGSDLLTSLEDKTPMRGLAFTYSGGYRILAADRQITTAEELQGLSMVTGFNPVQIDTAKAFGCVAKPVNIHDHLSNPNKDRATYHNGNNTVETTIPRYEQEAKTDKHIYVSNTKHSMYLTSIVIAKDFWNSLTESEQSAIQAAALHTSRLERQWSVDDADKVAGSKEEQDKLGIVYNEFTDEERAKLKETVQPLYNKYREFFSPNLIDGIIKG